MGADFSRAFAAVSAGMVAHADRDGLTGVKRAVFLDRGQHAPGEACPSAVPQHVPHEVWCDWPDGECECPPLRH